MGKLLSVFVIIFCLIFTTHALADDKVITNKINDVSNNVKTFVINEKDQIIMVSDKGQIIRINIFFKT